MPIALDIPLNALVSLRTGKDGIPARALNGFLQQHPRFRFYLIWSDVRHSSHALTWCPAKKKTAVPSGPS
jgi:hypothetical protein